MGFDLQKPPQQFADLNEVSEWVHRAWKHLEYKNIRFSTDNVTDPPSDAEIDTAFGQPDDVGYAFIGVIDDNGAGANVWLCVSDGSNWWYEALTKAV